MTKSLFTLILISSQIFANEYDFSMDELEEIQVKSFEYSGYLKAQHKYQIINKSSSKYPSKNKDYMNTYLGEAFLNLKYFKDKFSIQSDLMANYENKDNLEKDSYTINQAFVNYKYNQNHEINLGKKVARWGKGYFFNPIAFIDKKKDPNEPESVKEGFTQINYIYNKAFNKEIQNISFEASYLKTNDEINSDLFEEDSNNIALKTYFLYKDIDIDLAYFYSDKQANKYGFDFSTNIKTNFEIHAEFAKNDNSWYSYLLGLKYLSENELTITSEYFYQNQEQDKETPFWDNSYFINKFSQKEPFDMLYFNIYYKNSLNLDDKSHQNNLGFIYTGYKNLTFDFSIGKYFGENSSEFGNKLVDKFTWLQIKYSF